MRGALIVVAAASACVEARPRADDPACVGEGCSRIHGAGVNDRASATFHGAQLARAGYDLRACQRCHGPDLAGGSAKVSCAECHADRPDECATCHGEISASGAHAVHLEGGALGLRYGCEECHATPMGLTDLGHVLLAPGVIDSAPAELRFGARAGAAARFEVGSCGEVLCHAGRAVSWRGEPSGEGCARCHGMPPPDHASARCADCHPRVADDDGQLVGAALHLDGLVDLGDGSGDCASCHRMDDRPHTVHARAARELSPPIACAGCHLEPAAVGDVGHIDTAPPAEVFPAGFSGLAAARGASPTYAAGGCADTACHGPGPIAWDGPRQAVFCGSCHGIPPADVDHAPELRLTDCARCHGSSVGPRGEFLRPMRHLDGVVDR